MVRKIFLILSVFLLAYLGYAFFAEYFAYHQYYFNMLESWKNTKLVLNALIFGLLPAVYLLFAKRRNFRVLLAVMFASLFGYGIFYISTKGSLMGGAMKFFFNSAFLLGLAIYFLTSLLTVGDWIKQHLLRLTTKNIFGVVLSFGVGLAAFLLVIYVCILFTILHPAVSWLLFIGVGVLIFFQRERLTELWEIIDSAISTIGIPRYHQVWNNLIALPFLAYGILGLVAGESSLWLYVCLIVGGGLVASYLIQGVSKNKRGGRIVTGRRFRVGLVTLFLLMLSFTYLDMGYMLAYIPYSTAWDANHAYMFYPRMWGLNGGYYWNEATMAITPQLWYSYITYWFSLFGNFGGAMGISADTIAIQMNFWSGILVLLFGLGLISEVLSFLRDYHNKQLEVAGPVIFLLGRFLLLQWLFSGMGAFLVFIDNKTDLGVLALIILALYSGFVFLRRTWNEEHTDAEEVTTISQKTYTTIGLSGLFYALAVLAKPTAAFDVVNFGLFAWWFFLGALGAVGGLLLVVGILATIEFRGISDYMDASLGRWLLGVGAAGFGIDAVRLYLQKAWRGIRYLLVRAVVLAGVVLIVKGPWAIVHNSVFDKGYSSSELIQRVFLADRTSDNQQITDETEKKDRLATSARIPLLVQAGTGVATAPATCTLASEGVTSAEQLYTDLQEVTAGNEDLGRYVGYGWKGGTTDQGRGIEPFTNPIWGFFLQEGCYSFNPFDPFNSTAKILCQTEQDWKSWEKSRIRDVQEQLPEGTRRYEQLGELAAAIPADNPNINQLQTEHGDTVYQIEDYMQDHAIRVEVNEQGDKIVYFPYKFLNVFNITFNRSLQNLSSYYTDIGVVWLMLIFFIGVGLIYGLIKRYKLLVAISAVTLFGRFLRHLIASGILRYAIGIVVWTILAFLFYVYYLLLEEDVDGTFLGYIFVIGIFLFGSVQMVLNLQRIASQGGGGAFVWYKTNYGITEQYTDQLQRTTPMTNRFGKDDVFEMQFPHYQEFIELTNSRDDNEGALIAGTYARYFIDNQQNIEYDQFLTQLTRLFSDGDVCRSYLRLQDQHLKYLAIDPNIGTVVQGAGNQSLFDRFFGVVNNNEIVEYGVFTMLAELYEAGHVQYVSSNNLGAKYAFTMPDRTFTGLTGEALTIFRARMAIMRFFGGAQSPMFNAAVEIAMQRVKDGSFVTDLADMMGLQIRDRKLILLAQQSQLTPKDIQDANLTNDEKKALTNYLSIRQQASNDSALRNQLTQLMNNSIRAGNQVVVLEVTE